MADRLQLTQEIKELKLQIEEKAKEYKEIDVKLNTKVAELVQANIEELND
tara:strand:+ start:651 stop:800 length:150 start_codon:yes stop_codon:yes gene_type:complete